jgi:phage recombination protein Bet
MNAITKHESGGQLAEADLMHVLQSSLYPGASLDSIRMVLGYCKAAGLDPMQKPVHIVPMWDRQAGGMRDVIMPGVNLYRIQASRSGQFAGVSEPEFGPDVATTIGGQQITFPEWCRVVVRRQLSSGHIADFTAREYWMENYAVKGGKEKSIAPNAMWTKRPRGQIAKCATAQALRAAFPEIAAQYTHEEMDGKTINDVEEVDVLDQPKNFGLTPQRAKIVRAMARDALQKFNEDDEYGAYQEVESLQDNNEELMALWSILRPHSALRSALKRIAAEIKQRDDELAKMNVPATTEAAPSEPAAL